MKYQSLPVVRVPRRSWWNLINRHRVYLELQISVGSNQDWKNISKLAIIVIIIQKGFLHTSTPMPHISYVLFDKSISHEGIGGTAIIVSVPTKDVKLHMTPIMISHKPIIPFLGKLDLPEGKSLANHGSFLVAKSPFESKHKLGRVTP